MEYEHVTGLANGSFSKLRVLKDGSMQDILTLLGSGGGGGTYNDTAIWAAANQNTFNINANAAAISTKASTTALTTGLAGKQNTIADGDLTIAKTNGLQTALDGKQNTIADGDLSIAKTSGLQAALDSKQATLGANGSTGGSYLPGVSSPSTTAQLLWAQQLASWSSRPNLPLAMSRAVL